jgi:hypothetical protein
VPRGNEHQFVLDGRVAVEACLDGLDMPGGDFKYGEERTDNDTEQVRA